MKKIIDIWKSWTPVTRQICILAFVNIVIINLMILYRLYPTSLAETKGFFGGFHMYDSWEPMGIALEYLRSGSGVLIYDSVFFADNVKFQYPLTSLLLYAPTIKIVGAISWLAVIVTTVFVVNIFELSLKKAMRSEELDIAFGKYEKLARVIGLVALALTFYPVIKAYTLGQIQPWINAAFTIAVWCWLKNYKQVAGALTGFLCLIKPQYGVIAIWGLLRKHWVFLTSFMLVGLSGAVLSVLVFGLQNNLNYFKVLSFISKHGESYSPNQSMNGLLHRALFNGGNLTFAKDAFPPYHPVVYFGTLISSIILIVLALWPSAKKEKWGDIVDFSTIALVSTIASPVAWEHHYGITLALYAWLAPQLLVRKKFGMTPVILLCVSYVLVSNLFAPADYLADTYFNFLQSYRYFGSLILLSILYMFRVKESQVIFQGQANRIETFKSDSKAA